MSSITDRRARQRADRRLTVVVTAVAAAVALWLGLAAPSTSPVAPLQPTASIAPATPSGPPPGGARSGTP